MATKQKKDVEDSKTESDYSVFEDPDTNVSYANVSQVVVNSTDVALYFATISDGLSRRVTKYDTKIVVNHAAFMRMVEHWATRYHLFKQIYGDGPKSLDDFDPSYVNAAFAEMLNPSSEEAETSEGDHEK